MQFLFMFSLIEIVKFISFYKIKQKRKRHHCKIHLYFLVGFAVEEYVIVWWFSFLLRRETRTDPSHLKIDCLFAISGEVKFNIATAEVWKG